MQAAMDSLLDEAGALVVIGWLVCEIVGALWVLVRLLT